MTYALLLGASVLGACGQEEEPAPVLPPEEVNFVDLMEYLDRYEGHRVTFVAYPSVTVVDYGREKCRISVGDSGTDSHKDVLATYLKLSRQADHKGGIQGIITKKSGCNQGVNWEMAIPTGGAIITGKVKRSKEGILFVDIEPSGIVAIPE